MEEPGSNATFDLRVLLKNVFRDGTQTSLETVLQILCTRQDADYVESESALAEVVLRIQKQLNPEKGANTIVNCLSLVEYLVINGPQNVRAAVWSSGVRDLIESLKGINKHETIGGNIGAKITEKVSAVQTHILNALGRLSESPVLGGFAEPCVTSCPECREPLESESNGVKALADEFQNLLLEECSSCGYAFCTNCGLAYHGLTECQQQQVRHGWNEGKVWPNTGLVLQRETLLSILRSQPSNGCSSQTFEHGSTKLQRLTDAKGEREESCPRCQRRHLDVIEGEVLGICTSCGYVFCRRCQQNYHGVTQCIMAGFDAHVWAHNLRDTEEQVPDFNPTEMVVKEGFECNTCGDDFDDNHLASFGCEHKACILCVKGYFEVQIREGEVHALVCLQDGCDVKATQGLVRSAVDLETFMRYEEVLLDEALADVPEIVTCPQFKCQKRIIAEGMYGHCVACDYRFCTACNRAYHGLVECGKSDEQVRRKIRALLAADERQRQELERQEEERRRLDRIVNEQQSVGFISGNCKKCPGCKADTEKNLGCNHMTCSRCRTQYCWLCLGPWSFLHRCRR